jgi:diguanylate cyclase (GGDEF)-like protein
MQSGIRYLILTRFGAIAALVGVAALVGFKASERAALRMAQAQYETTLAPVIVARLTAAMWELRHGCAQYLIEDDPEHRAELRTADTKLYGVVARNAEALAALLRTPATRQEFDEFQQAYRRYIEARPRWFELVDRGDLPAAAAWRMRTTSPFALQTLAGLAQLNDAVEREAELRRHELSAAFRLRLPSELAILASVLLLIFGFGFLVTHELVRPLESLQAAIQRFARGDAAARAPTDLAREAGAVAAAFNSMADSLQRQQASLAQANAEFEQRVAEARTANEALRLQTQELQDLNRERAGIADLNHMLLSCCSLAEAYEVFRRSATVLFPGLPGALHVYAASRDHLELAASWGEIGAGKTVYPEACWALRRGKAHAGGGQHPACQHAGPVADATLCVPLHAQGETIGVLQLRAPDAESLRRVRPAAEVIGDILGLALANLRLRESLRSLSIRDQLTGLFNRRYLEETFERELQRAERAGKPLAVMMIDIDHFKLFNDRFGHEAGDAVLREIGRFLRGHARGEDIVCRHGGEELAVVLPDADLAAARARAEQLRAGVRRLELSHAGRSVGPLTISVGVVVFPHHGRSWQTLLRIADEALYAAKEQGRDRVVVAAPEASTARFQVAARA